LFHTLEKQPYQFRRHSYDILVTPEPFQHIWNKSCDAGAQSVGNVCSSFIIRDVLLFVMSLRLTVEKESSFEIKDKTHKMFNIASGNLCACLCVYIFDNPIRQQINKGVLQNASCQNKPKQKLLCLDPETTNFDVN